MGMLPVNVIAPTKLLLCRSNFMDIIRLSQSWVKSGHPQFLGCCWM